MAKVYVVRVEVDEADNQEMTRRLREVAVEVAGCEDEDVAILPEPPR